MLTYSLRKLGHTAFVALGVVTLVFVALRLSGDPAATMLPGDASVDELRRAAPRPRPRSARSTSSTSRFLSRRRAGDFGESFRHQQPALALVLERLPATLELAFAALLLAVVVALPLGIVAALYRGRLADMLAMALRRGRPGDAVLLDGDHADPGRLRRAGLAADLGAWRLAAPRSCPP